MDTKNKTKIKAMQEGGAKLAKIRDFLAEFTKPGKTLLSIEKKASQMIIDSGAELSFAKVPGYRFATCININDGFVHGIPNNYQVRDGDLVSIDIGLYYKGFHTDTAVSFIAGDPKSQEQSNKLNKLLTVGKNTLSQLIEIVHPGIRVGEISRFIYNEVEKKAGYSVARTLTGHGVGEKLHQFPKIPCLPYREIGLTPELIPGMTIALEVLYLEGKPDIITDTDGWTIRSKDGKMTAIFEKTIAITDDGSIVLT